VVLEAIELRSSTMRLPLPLPTSLSSGELRRESKKERTQK